MYKAKKTGLKYNSYYNIFNSFCNMLKLKSLSGFILSVTLATSIIVFLSTYFIIYNSIKNVTEKKAIEQTRSIAKHTFNDMYQIMRKGWTREEVLEFLKGIDEAYKNIDIEVNIFRGEIVSELFGRIKEQKKSQDVLRAFKEKTDIFLRKGNKLIYIYPLIANRECLKCHINAKEGDVLGVIEVVQDISGPIAAIKKSISKITIFTLPVLLTGALLVVIIITRKIENSLNKLDESINKIHKVSDLSSLDFSKIYFGFNEFDKIKKSIEKLVLKMNKIAIDKDILEFEVKLLESFILTSEAIKNWTEFFKKMLSDLSVKIGFSYFWVLVKEEDKPAEAYIFWNLFCHKDTDKCRKFVERVICEAGKVIGCQKKDIIYHYISISAKSTPFNPENLSYHFKTITLHNPQLSVQVGVAIEETDSVKKVAIEGLLATLLNTAGSIFAINSYMRQLEFFATRDPLTGLYNQRVFWELFDYEVKRAKRHNYKFALFVIDIDNFKLVNDTYGHEFGDKFLHEVAQQLRKVFRSEDIIARYGGDEFCVLLPYTDAEGAAIVAKRLIDNIKNFSIETPDGDRVNITVSVGIAIFPDHGEDPKSLFILADNVMYKAKRLGKNRFLIAGKEDTIEIEEETAKKKLLITSAIKENRIIPYFQPIVEVKTGNVFGYEVLMRINSGDRIIPASEFIDTAEGMGVIHKLDLKVIEKALMEVKHSNCSPFLFFNLSPQVMIVPEFLEQILDKVNTVGFNKEKIVFEITERETIRNIELLKEFIQELKKEGLKFAIDDFGSGYASFTYLKKLPVDFVKIDGDFVRNVISSSIDRVFVESAVSMSQVLNIKTIAEFIENREIYEAIKKIGVDFAQGFYIGKPSREICNKN